MRHSTVVRSWTALAVGMAFAAGTIYVLVEDVIKGGPVTTNHVITVLALGGTTYAGHHFLLAVRSMRIMSAIGLLAVFLTGTALLVAKSGGRNAEVQLTKTLTAKQDNAELARLQKELAEAKAHRDRWIALTANECASGRGAKCTANEKTRDAAEVAYTVAEKKLHSAPQAKVENGDIRYAAKAVRVILALDMDQGKIEEWLELFLPFGMTVLLELGTAVFIGYGLGHTKPRHSKVSIDSLPPPREARDEAVIDWVRAYQAHYGQKPQIPEVQRQFKLSKSTAWRRIRAA